MGENNNVDLHSKHHFLPVIELRIKDTVKFDVLNKTAYELIDNDDDYLGDIVDYTKLDKYIKI